MQKREVEERSNTKKGNVEDSFTAGFIIRTSPIFGALYCVLYVLFFPRHFYGWKCLDDKI
jgi:hypothetical protein